VPAPVKKSGTFNLFGPTPAPQPKKVEPTPAPAPVKKSGTFNLFGPSPAKPQPKVEPPAPVPVKKAGFNMFGSPAPKKAAPAPVPVKNAPVKRFGNAAAPAMKDNIPLIKRFVRNADGSVTGFISNSPNFRDGERITTSPVRGTVKSGVIVKTGSGSQYRLE